MIFRVNRLLAVPFPALRRLIGLCGLAAALSLSVAPPAAAQKDTIAIGIQENVASLDPAKSWEVMGYGLLNQAYDTLITFSGDNFTEPIPKLAESWDISADGLTWTFHLRPGVTFASGNPVNADAVIFSFSRVGKINAGPAYILTQLGISEETLTKLDDLTVRMRLNKPYAPGMVFACLSQPIAMILDQQVVLAHEQNGDLGSAWLEEHFAGSGRFVLTAQKRGAFYTFEANERYWGTPPAFQKLDVKIVQEPAEQAMLLTQGELDVAWNLPPDQARALGDNADMRVFQSTTFQINTIGMNVAYPPFQKPEVREALRYAVDYDGIIDMILQGGAEKIQTCIVKGLPGYNPAMPFTFDLDKAKQLLAAGGYPDGFEVELKTFNYSPWIDIAMKVKADLEQIGVRMKISQLDAGQMWNAIMSRDIQMYLEYWVHDYPDPDGSARLLVYADDVSENAAVKTLMWMLTYADNATAQLIDQAVVEHDMEKRLSLYHQVTENILHAGPYIFLCTPIQYYGVRAEVADFLQQTAFVMYDFPTVK